MADARPDRGFALLIVLWTLVLLTLLIATMTAASRSEARVAANLRNAAIAREAVDGAMQEAIFRLAAGQWTPGARPYSVRIGEVAVAVQVEDAAGRVDPNRTSLPMLRALLEQIGLPPAQAAALGGAIWDYTSIAEEASPGGGAKAAEYAAAGRPYGPPNHPFLSVRELGVVLGMTPDILARLAPYVAVGKAGGFEVAKADPLVRRAFAAAGPQGGYRSGQLEPSDIVTLCLVATAAGPNAATRRAVVRLPQDARAPGPAYWLMDWD